jgi:hypothetical protein
MNRNDSDLVAVREVAAEVAGHGGEPSPDAVARTWSRIAERRRPRTRKWAWATAPAAAVAVVAVAVGAAFALPRDNPVGPDAGGATQTAPAPPTGIPPSLGELVRVLPAGQVIDEMAAKAATVPPVAIPAGKFLYVRSDATSDKPDGTRVTDRYEMWLDPDGMHYLKIVVDGKDMPVGGPSVVKSDGTRIPVNNRPTGGPTLTNPTPQWLATLPTDPDTLLDMLQALSPETPEDPSRYVMEGLGELFFKCEPVLTPAVRAALYNVLHELDGLTAAELRIAGRKTYMISRSWIGGGSRDVLLFDPTTGRVVSRVLDLGPANGDTRQVVRVETWHHAVVDSVGQTG